MRKMKKINGWLIVRFNDREKRIYVGVIGSYGVIDAELYTGDLDMDRGAMEYDNAETLEEAVELARGLPSEEDLNDEQMTFTLVAEGAESFREERIEPQALIVAEENRLRTQVGSSFYKDVDERTAAHELYGFKTALNQLGLLGDDETPVDPHHFGTAPNPLPRQPEDLLAYVCDHVCKHRAACQSGEELEELCEKCALTRLYDEASGADRRKRPRKTGFRHAPEKGGINPAALFELGLKLERSCPKNDCTIYLNTFRQAREADEALSILAGYAKTVVERDFRKLLRELERMYLTTPAVRIYRNQNPLKSPGWEAGCGEWVERLVSEFGVGLDGQLFSSEELLKHTGKRVLHQYFDITSIIDYLCVGLASCDYDGFGKNQQYLTYDGQLWYANYYDKDSTWLLMYTGQGFLAADYLNFLRTDGNLLYGRLSDIFISEIQARWPVLRSGPLSFENIISRFEQFIRICPPHIVAEDYADTTGGGAFTGIPSVTTNNIQQIRAAVKARLAFCDDYIANLESFVPVACTGITLDQSELTFESLTTQTLIATITPEDCTESVIWESDNEAVATVKNGVVTPAANGSANITVRCGEQSASCAITVSGVQGNIMSGVNWSLGGMNDQGTVTASTSFVVSDLFDITEYVGQALIVEYSEYADYAQRQAFFDSAGAFVTLERHQITNNQDDFINVPADAATIRVQMVNETGASVALKTATTEDIGFSELEQHNGNLNYTTGELGEQLYGATTCYVPVTPGEEYKCESRVKKVLKNSAT